MLICKISIDLLRLMSNNNFFLIRWIEIWQRKHRQYQEDRCISYDKFQNFEREEGDEFSCWDNGWDDDIRETFCLNKNNVSLSNLLKTELECEWATASTIELNTIFLVFSVILAAVY